jgi:hypothetical protein
LKLVPSPSQTHDSAPQALRVALIHVQVLVIYLHVLARSCWIRMHEHWQGDSDSEANGDGSGGSDAAVRATAATPPRLVRTMLLVNA